MEGRTDFRKRLDAYGSEWVFRVLCDSDERSHDGLGQLHWSRTRSASEGSRLSRCADFDDSSDQFDSLLLLHGVLIVAL